MGFIKRMFGLETKAGSVSMSSDLASVVFGGRPSRSGVAVSPERAIEVATVLACVRVIANGVAQVPWRLYREGDGGRLVAREHPLSIVLHRRPNPWQTSYEMRETMMFHAILTGNAYAFVNRVGSARQVAEVIPIEPGRVSVEQGDDYRLRYTVSGKNSRQVFPQEAIWHLRGPSWNGWRGLDAVKLARDAIGLTIALENSQADFQKNGGKTSGMYSVASKLPPEKYALLRSWFDQEMQGDGGYRPLILDDGAKYTPFTMTGVDQQLIETRKHQIEEVCRAFGVMPIMIGHADKTATYASAEQMFLAHVVHTLDPWYQRIEQSADVQLLSAQEQSEGYYTKFTPNALMRGAARDRAEFYVRALGTTQQPGWMTRNEVRGLEEMDPVQGGDAFPELITAGGEGDDDAKN
jgi:HK97 family phage portal protein